MKTRKPPVPPEREIQKTAMAVLKARGWRVFRRNTGAMRAAHKGRERLVRFSQKGQADAYGITPAGHHFECELKRPGEWPTPAQVAWLESTNGIGGSVAFWISRLEDLEEVAAHVERGGRIRFEAGGTGRYELVT